jgi:hypothetical protein
MEILSRPCLLNFFSILELTKIQHLSHSFYEDVLPRYMQQINKLSQIKQDIPSIENN